MTKSFYVHQTFSFDAAGNLTGKTYPNGVTTSFAYDADNRLTSQQATKDAQTLQSYSQSFDAAGNITQLTENGTLTTSYGYDQLSRLTGENIGGYGNVSYSYDQVGNRLTLENPTTGHTNYSYNQANQLTEQVNGADTTNFTYDANGALTQKTRGTDITGYSYNGMDKLTEVTTPATTVDYAYDALGRRISRTENGATANSHFSAKTDLTDYETDSTGNLTASMQRGPDGMTLYTGYSGGQSFYGYQLYSPHGDTTAITDQTGALDYAARFDSFGNTISGGGFNYGYTSKWQRNTDFSTGTIQMGVREYDPVVGRFVSADPLKGMPKDPLQRNRYNFVKANPLNHYDVTGYSMDFWNSMLSGNSFASLTSEADKNYDDPESIRFGADQNGNAACATSLDMEGADPWDLIRQDDELNEARAIGGYGKWYEELEGGILGPSLLITGPYVAVVGSAALEISCTTVGGPAGTAGCATAVPGIFGGGAALTYAGWKMMEVNPVWGPVTRKIESWFN